jgi:hypothetical protein
MDPAWLELMLCTAGVEVGPLGPGGFGIAPPDPAEIAKVALESAARNVGQQAVSRLAGRFLPGGLGAGAARVSQVASRATAVVSQVQTVASTVEAVRSGQPVGLVVMGSVANGLGGLGGLGALGGLGIELPALPGVDWAVVGPALQRGAANGVRVASCLETVGAARLQASLDEPELALDAQRAAMILGSLGEATASQAPAAATPPSGPVDFLAMAAEDVPLDLRTGGPEQRWDLLVAVYEAMPTATATIAWVMLNDPDYDIRFKAWRVVRARWARGTGLRAEHQAIATWLAVHGEDAELREEAVLALGRYSDDLGAVEAALTDEERNVRATAGATLATMGRRLGRLEEARANLDRGVAQLGDARAARAVVEAFEEEL